MHIILNEADDKNNFQLLLNAIVIIIIVISNDLTLKMQIDQSGLVNALKTPLPRHLFLLFYLSIGGNIKRLNVLIQY